MKGLGPYQKPTFLSLILVSFFSLQFGAKCYLNFFRTFFIAIYVPRGPLTPSTLGCQQLKYLSQRTKLVHPPTPMSQLLLHAPHNTPPTIIHLFRKIISQQCALTAIVLCASSLPATVRSTH